MIKFEDIKHLSSNQFEDILLYFSKSILGNNNEEDILWVVAKNCISKLGFEDCVIYLIDTNQTKIIQKAAFGKKSRKNKLINNPIEISLGKGVTGSVALSGHAEIIHDTSKDFRYIKDKEMHLSEIAVPIKTDSVIYGIIDCKHPEKDFFTVQHLKILSAIASICAIKIENVRAEKLLKEKQETLLKINQQITDLKLKAFNTQMNPHFVFNALNAIQYFITSENKKSALEYLSVFSKLIRFYLKHIEVELVQIDNEIAMLSWYLKLQKLRYNNLFNFSISITKDEKHTDAKIPSFIIQTLLENIIEHSIFNQHKNQKIDILFSLTDDFVKVTITYKHNPEAIKKNSYTPEYRERIIEWQDQMRLLNATKKYNIEKKVKFIKNETYFSGGIITLKLPNLN